MNVFDRLQETIAKFPGIGPRQARRIAFFLGQVQPEFRTKLLFELKQLHDTATTCSVCGRQIMHASMNSKEAAPLCSICADTSRDQRVRMIVSTSLDIEAIEKTGAYRGTYYVFGPHIALSHKEPSTDDRIKRLMNFFSKIHKDTLKEIIISLSATPEGQHTAHSIHTALNSLDTLREEHVHISQLGRGMSTGTEIEYIDEGTFTAAFSGRKQLP